MNMDRCDENSRVAARSTGFKAVPMEMAKAAPDAANNRRALRDITSLMRPVSGPPPCPPAFLKKSLTDKKQDCDKKSIAPAVPNRPITRRFAAALKSKGGSQDLNLPPSSSSSLGTCTAIDVDDFTKQVNGLPMEEEMEEVMFNNNTYELKEVEMEDLEEEADDLMPDIDSCDRSNPLAVVDYVDDIYSFYRKTEVRGCASPDYMSSQFDINERMRGILIDWLIEVHYKFELMDETLFLMVNIIDRFLANHVVVRKKLQLVGVTAMLLACKYEEVSVPVVEDLILISDRAYTREEVLQMEKLIVNTLQFNFSVPTIYVFMRRFLKAADFDKKLELLSFFLVELCLVEYEMLRFQPSLLAAAAVYTAQCTLKGAKQWNRTCEAHTTYTEEQLMECARMMVGFHIKAGNGKLTGVHRKYSTFKFGFAAKYEPALFVLEA